MFKTIITIDYEIHGNGDGCPFKLMVEPTYRMMNLFDNYGAKLTIMADVAEILKFKEYKEKFGKDKYYFEDILKQLKYAVKNGHDVQLHIHSGYFNSEFTDKGIKQSWDEYDLANMPYSLINERIKQCKDFLNQELKPVSPSYECIAFRAANWSMVPTRNISQALIANGVTIDTSVFKWGVRNGRVKFDYTNAPDRLIPWFINVNDVCLKDDSGKLLEIPIYTEQRYFWYFITLIRAFRMIRALFHKHEKYELPMPEKTNMNLNPVSNQHKNIKKSKIKKFTSPFTQKHSWKMDINQASASQLINATKRIENEYAEYEYDLPLVLIGHSKSFIKYNRRTLEPFLKFIQSDKANFNFALFKDLNLENYRI